MFVYFDAVGTLLFPQPDVISVYFAHGQACGSGLTAAEIHASFSRLYARHFCRLQAEPGNLQTSESRERERWANLVSELFGSAAASGELFDRLWNHFAQPSSWELYPDVPPTLEELGRRGIAWGIASNFDHRLVSIVKAKAELSAARSVVTSAAAGWSKPAVEFYRWAASSAAEPLANSVPDFWMVGDNWQLDIVAARAAGWRAVHLDRKGEGPAASDRIRSLGELLSLWQLGTKKPSC